MADPNTNAHNATNLKNSLGREFTNVVPSRNSQATSITMGLDLSRITVANPQRKTQSNED